MDSFVNYVTELGIVVKDPSIMADSYDFRFVANLPAWNKIIWNKSEYHGFLKFLMVCHYKIGLDLYSFKSETLPESYSLIRYMQPPPVLAHIPALKIVDYINRPLGVPIDEWARFIVNDVKLVET